MAAAARNQSNNAAKIGGAAAKIGEIEAAQSASGKCGQRRKRIWRRRRHRKRRQLSGFAERRKSNAKLKRKYK